MDKHGINGMYTHRLLIEDLFKYNKWTGFKICYDFIIAEYDF